MNEEELNSLKNAKKAYYEQLIELKGRITVLQQELHMAEDKFNKAKRKYELLDRTIAMKEKLTSLPPSGTGIKEKKPKNVYKEMSKQDAMELLGLV